MKLMFKFLTGAFAAILPRGVFARHWVVVNTGTIGFNGKTIIRVTPPCRSRSFGISMEQAFGLAMSLSQERRLRRSYSLLDMRSVFLRPRWFKFSCHPNGSVTINGSVVPVSIKADLAQSLRRAAKDVQRSNRTSS